MRIVLLIRSLGCGGAERQALLLAGHLGRRHDVSVMTFYAGDDFFCADAAPAAFRRVRLGKRGRWDLAAFGTSFLKAIRQARPDVIYAFMGTASLLSLAARLTHPRPRLVWGIRASNMDLRRYGTVHRVLRQVERLASPLADLVIPNSEAGRRQAIREGFRHDILVVPNGIDSTRFARDEEGARRIRAELGIPPGAPVVGIVARHDPMKGYETFLRAAGIYREANTLVYFLSVGDGDAGYTASLTSLAAGLHLGSRMIWAGAAVDLAPYYSAMTLLTSSSAFGEGFSNAVGEAMSCGVPCVVTDVGDSAAIVADTGWVVPPGAPAALAKAWDTALRLPAPELRARGEAARRRVAGSYSEERTVTLTEAALTHLVQTT